MKDEYLLSKVHPVLRIIIFIAVFAPPYYFLWSSEVTKKKSKRMAFIEGESVKYVRYTEARSARVCKDLGCMIECAEEVDGGYSFGVAPPKDRYAEAIPRFLKNECYIMVFPADAAYGYEKNEWKDYYKK